MLLLWLLILLYYLLIQKEGQILESQFQDNTKGFIKNKIF